MQIADQEDNKDGRCAGEAVSTGAFGRAFRWQASFYGVGMQEAACRRRAVQDPSRCAAPEAGAL